MTPISDMNPATDTISTNKITPTDFALLNDINN